MARRSSVHTIKPLFIPLRGEYFRQFRDGEKFIELRPYGARWNERTCVVGRPAVLSHGYGKQHRLRGTVASYGHCLYTELRADLRQQVRDVYGTDDRYYAAIGIKLEDAPR